MHIITGRAEWRAALDAHRLAGATVGFVPTMGALHEGHGSLVATAAGSCDVTAASIFVNPLQFGDAADLAAYPRVLEDDAALLDAAGCDLVFAPSVGEVYPGFPVLPSTLVTTKGAALGFEGAGRPGHFDGVATVLTKLFSLTGPCRAYFGEKDFQQVAVVRQVVEDLWLPVEVIACPTIRARDGLALSSRNRRLSDAGRAAATVLSAALVAAADRIAAGASVDEAEATMREVIAAEPMASLEYAVVVDPHDVAPVSRLAPGIPVRLLVVAEIEGVRLLDNMGAVPDAGLR
jgi:pantoate--beta-alanine ligase